MPKPVLLTAVAGALLLAGGAGAGAAGAPAAAFAYDELVEVTITWDGTDSSTEFAVNLFGEDGLILVPGGGRTTRLRVFNDGPTDGLLTASLIETAIFQAENAGDDVHDFLAIGGFTATDLAGGDQVVASGIAVAAGAFVDLDLTVALPAAVTGVTSGNAGLAHIGPQSAQFRVRLDLTGELPEDGGQDQCLDGYQRNEAGECVPVDGGEGRCPDGHVRDDDGECVPVGGGDNNGGGGDENLRPAVPRLPVTGGGLAALSGAVALTGAGVLSLVAGRRRRGRRAGSPA
ncbi:MAG: trypsin inhibitor-like cysteine-rich domain-containing protein [Promicromonosporaceae bacterium]|nr:trypsin inhibitor-like cysteine-rich domain-containing protein [Promicromonosporaceae bacterium]